MPTAPLRAKSPLMGRKASTTPPTGPTPSDVLQAVLKGKAPDLSISEIARRTGMARPNVSRVMSGETPYPSVQTVEAILAAMGATLCDYHRAKSRIEKTTD